MAAEKKLTKAAFIRSMPEAVKAETVVAAGKTKGLTFDAELVHSVRSKARRKGKKKAKRAASMPAQRVPVVANGTTPQVTPKDRVMAIVREHGMTVTRKALGEIERELRAALR